MRRFLMLCAVLLVLASRAHAGGMIMPGATPEGIMDDCLVTAELSVQLLKMKAKNPPEKLYEYSRKLLREKGYKGSFGEPDFVARFYTGMALQSGEEVDRVMEKLSPEDLNTMKEEHEGMCLNAALKEYADGEAAKDKPAK